MDVVCTEYWLYDSFSSTSEDCIFNVDVHVDVHVSNSKCGIELKLWNAHFLKFWIEIWLAQLWGLLSILEMSCLLSSFCRRDRQDASARTFLLTTYYIQVLHTSRSVHSTAAYLQQHRRPWILIRTTVLLSELLLNTVVWLSEWRSIDYSWRLYHKHYKYGTNSK